MKKTVLAAFAVYAGVALQVQAQYSWPEAIHITTQNNVNGIKGEVITPATTKLGLLSFSLNNRFQAYKAGTSWGVAVKPSDPRLQNGAVNWDNISYTYSDAVDCNGAITYKSATRVINNNTIIAAINKALSWPVGKNVSLQPDDSVLGGPLAVIESPFYGAFTTAAKIVAVNYDNGRYLPPYPPTQDYVGDEGSGEGQFDTAVWNAPWALNLKPDVYIQEGTNYNQISGGTIIPLNWPNLNYISWGKLWLSGDSAAWAGARVFIVDPKNSNENLRCFDVTPFFALEESYCYYCWDTMDRVTDGKINFGTSSSLPPCAGGTYACGTGGSGTTRFYWTVKFDNVQGAWEDDANAPNNVLSHGLGRHSLYYNSICNFEQSWGDTFGFKLDDSDQPNSKDALCFNVSGIATYTWKFKALSDGASWPVGRYSMSASGHGFSPMCGVFSGTVSMTEFDKTASTFGKVVCP